MFCCCQEFVDKITVIASSKGEYILKRGNIYLGLRLIFLLSETDELPLFARRSEE